jgi:hypothetical protein
VLVVDNRFVFVHVHKTGGQFIRRFFFDFFRDVREVGYHYPLTKLPRRFRGLPVVAFIRNPCDWYVSWYTFNTRLGINPIFQVLSERATLDINETIENLVNLGSSDAKHVSLRRQTIGRLPWTMSGNHLSGITKRDLARFLSDEVGYLTWLLRRMVFDAPRHGGGIHVGRQERLGEDLLRTLETIGVPPSDEMKMYVESAPRLNKSGHVVWSKMLSENTVQLIQSKDRWIFETFGYPVPRHNHISD